VRDPIGVLGQSQNEVIVLAPVESRLEAAELDCQRASVDAQMARVHQSSHVLGRPAGLWMPLYQHSVPDDVFVGVDHVEVGLGGDLVGDVSERVGGEGVVVVQQGDVLASGELEAVLVAVEIPPAVCRRLS